MMNEVYTQQRILPAINETFPRFNRPHSLISPLDLSLRPPNAIPITPPTTPSPPRKRQRLMTDDSYLWRPHVMATLTQSTTATTSIATLSPIATATTATLVAGDYTHSSMPCTYHSLDGNAYKSNCHDTGGNHLLENVSGERNARPAQAAQTIYVDDETIVLTEDEDETLVSSHEYTEDMDEEFGVDDDDDDDDDDDEEEDAVHAAALAAIEATHKQTHGQATRAVCSASDVVTATVDEADEEEEEFVDILSNDDDDGNPLSSDNNTRTTTALLLKSQLQADETELAKSGSVLTRNKLVYDNAELHQQAINGLEKLFDKDFRKERDNASADTATQNAKVYTELTSCRRELHADQQHSADSMTQQGILNANGATEIAQPAATRPVTYHKSHKNERKRMKLRKHHAVDEETISPVSGTIIRKLRDDEELVVRKGDIDPAFNVVEITEEAKAILASIDNKIGAYLCQLCRTLYDDAFMLAQHRCPRIVHIEYKCSECEKVFNCPANLASHRRWHKPKTELLANSQIKKRAVGEQLNAAGLAHDKTSGSTESADGIYPCTQCGKTFRRHAYLKKHQASHQILENLKTYDIFKGGQHLPVHAMPAHAQHLSMHQQHLLNQSQLSTPSHTHAAVKQQQQQADPLLSNSSAPQRLSHGSYYPTNKSFAPRFGAFPFPAFDHRRFYSLGELYISQQLERTSAFQYVHANHLRNLSSTANNLLPRPMFPPLMPMPVK